MHDGARLVCTYQHAALPIAFTLHAQHVTELPPHTQVAHRPIISCWPKPRVAASAGTRAPAPTLTGAGLLGEHLGACCWLRGQAGLPAGSCSPSTPAILVEQQRCWHRHYLRRTAGVAAFAALVHIPSSAAGNVRPVCRSSSTCDAVPLVPRPPPAREHAQLCLWWR